jgi:hypothetical protein
VGETGKRGWGVRDGASEDDFSRSKFHRKKVETLWVK